MKCSICDNQFHFRARCPQSASSSGGHRGTIAPAGTQGTTHFMAQGPLAGAAFMTTQSTQDTPEPLDVGTSMGLGPTDDVRLPEDTPEFQEDPLVANDPWGHAGPYPGASRSSSSSSNAVPPWLAYMRSRPSSYGPARRGLFLGQPSRLPEDGSAPSNASGSILQWLANSADSAAD